MGLIYLGKYFTLTECLSESEFGYIDNAQHANARDRQKCQEGKNFPANIAGKHQ